MGINIAPLLAGAGVVGSAVAFGAQTLVRDIISGVFFLADDAFRLGEYIEIKVADTGVGIPSEELPKIFDKFYRVKHPKTREVMGTGLGLAIVKGVVEAHHGTIDVESVVDEGTTFRILLPVIN